MFLIIKWLFLCNLIKISIETLTYFLPPGNSVKANFFKSHFLHLLGLVWSFKLSQGYHAFNTHFWNWPLFIKSKFQTKNIAYVFGVLVHDRNKDCCYITSHQFTLFLQGLLNAILYSSMVDSVKTSWTGLIKSLPMLMRIKKELWLQV